MKLLPPSTNADYAGRLLAARGLTLLAVLTILPGLIHTLLPDGGAGVIAGLDLSTHRDVIVGVFAWAGATQMVWGALLLAISLRYRTLVPLGLSLLLFERAVIALNIWILKPGASDHRPPEAYASVIVLPILALLIAASLSPKKL
jgi:hypothetical protein